MLFCPLKGDAHSVYGENVPPPSLELEDTKWELSFPIVVMAHVS